MFHLESICKINTFIYQVSLTLTISWNQYLHKSEAEMVTGIKSDQDYEINLTSQFSCLETQDKILIQIGSFIKYFSLQLGNCHSALANSSP